jgi:hypothetical protein
VLLACSHNFIMHILLFHSMLLLKFSLQISFVDVGRPKLDSPNVNKICPEGVYFLKFLRGLFLESHLMFADAIDIQFMVS